MTRANRSAWRAAATAAGSVSWLLGIALAFVIGLGALHEVARVLRRAHELDGRAALARARLVADAAAWASCGQDGATRTAVGGVTATVGRDGDGIVVATSDTNGAVHRFVAPYLTGAAPGAFAHALAAATPGAVAGAVAIALPRLDDACVQRAVGAEATRVLRRDQGVALLHLEAGTDADDFVFPDRAIVDLGAAGELLLVPGHLWVPPAPQPIEVRVPSDRVVVIQGNLYLGRSLRVVGGGRLLLATVPRDGATSFADADGNGRWSTGDRLLERQRFHGPVEGAASVWCGFGPGAAIDCDGGLFVGGELHVARDVEVAGPVVLAHGVTSTAPRAQLRAAGEWCFNPERERVPGFATSGKPRPGLLRRSGAPASAMDQQTLYGARIAR